MSRLGNNIDSKNRISLALARAKLDLETRRSASIRLHRDDGSTNGEYWRGFRSGLDVALEALADAKISIEDSLESIIE